MAATRAEARKKAILARGNDRLAKLATSARGEDNPVYTHNDPPVPTISSNFIGEESPIPPSRLSKSPTPSPAHPLANGSQPDPPMWSEDQQRQFMQALMGGQGRPGFTPPQISSSAIQPDLNEFTGMNIGGMGGNDTLSALMSQLQAQGGAPGSMPPPQTHSAPPKPRTLIQKLLPLIHFICVWALFAYFVIWKEPVVFDSVTYGAVNGKGLSLWGSRWGELRSRNTTEAGWSVQAVPFFWAFITLQLALHSLHIFSGFDAIQPHFLLTMALPHLPAPIPFIITTGLKYIQMGGFILDDLAALIFGVAVLVTIGGITERWQT